MSKDQQDLVTAAVEKLPPRLLREWHHAEHVAIERLRRAEIGRVEHGFENALRGHGQTLV
jgi:hypothetical protein